MSATRYLVLEALRRQPEQLVSGGELAEKLGLSRTAVWKAVASLQEEGYQIEPVSNKGYRYLGGEVFSGYEVERRLQTKSIGRPLIFLETVDSTNQYAKELGAGDGVHGTVVIARRQTQGRGRLSRSFASPVNKGVYLTILLRPAITLGDLNLITLLMAVVGADTIEALSGVRPGIKWTNDLYLAGKKICGILTECAVEGESGAVSYAAAGIGMNLLEEPTDFPEEIREVAGSVLTGTGKHVALADYAAALLKHFEEWFSGFPDNRETLLETYRKDLLFLNRKVEVRGMRETYPAVALDIDGEGRLLVRREDGTVTALNSGEISVHPL